MQNELVELYLLPMIRRFLSNQLLRYLFKRYVASYLSVVNN